MTLKCLVVFSNISDRYNHFRISHILASVFHFEIRYTCINIHLLECGTIRQKPKELFLKYQIGKRDWGFN